MEPTSTHILDRELIKLNAYRLLTLFYANKEIARLSDPNRRDDMTSKLEKTFFSREMTKYLLNISIGVRVLDDQMKTRPADDPMRQKYFSEINKINQEYHCMMFEDEIDLRGACNKIIHAITVVPREVERFGSHVTDEYNSLGSGDVDEQLAVSSGFDNHATTWKHFSGDIHLRGWHNGKEWTSLLQVPIFVEAVFNFLQTQH